MASGTQKGNGTTFTWLGHSAVRLTTPEGKIILIDPWLENPKAPETAAEIESVDAILVTHGHFDHLGNTEELAKNHGATVVAIHEVATFLENRDVENVVGMNKGGTVEVAGVRVTMVTADHSSGISTDDGIVSGGAAAGLILEFSDGTCIYHSGDTHLFGDMKLIAELYKPRIGFVCIGGHYTMGPAQAATACRWLGLRTVVPIHWGTFPVLSGTPKQLKEALKGSSVHVLEPKTGVETPLGESKVAA
jgi:L-ascorbate metabolism protein UlaG (beta-lactamase superfamily)